MTERVAKYIHLSLGTLCVILGLIGAVLPVMPTTVFMILAAFFFTKGSPKLRQKLLDNAYFGPTIRTWEETGAIPRRVKVISIAMMGTAFTVSLFYLPTIWLVIQGGLITIAIAYILTRPDA